MASRVLIGFIFILALAAPLIPQQEASAATIVVTHAADDGAGSLREAILNATAGDTITFASSWNSTITVEKYIEINKSLNIVGPGADQLIISGGGVVRVLTVMPGAVVTLSGLTISGGGALLAGGIANHGTLTITNCIISDNLAVFSHAGGIYNEGTLTITNSTISGNEADRGAGIANKGNLTITNSTISGNEASSGAGIFHLKGATALQVTNSTISDNIADFFGGGIFNDGDAGTVTISSSIISGNAGDFAGGVYNNGTMNILNSTISGNSNTITGGGIVNNATMSIDGATISGNHGRHGAGIDNVGSLEVTNSTISGNTSVIDGGGIDNIFGTLTLTNSTIAGNTASSGAGVLGTATMVGTIVANNLIGGNCVGSITSGGSNLSSDATCFAAGGSDLTDTDPLLGPLSDNGGPTQTHAIALGSPAYNAGGAAPCPTDVDQRGEPRPQNGACDIGAFEIETVPPTPPVLTLNGPGFVQATGPDGAAVTLDVSAVDWEKSALPVSCTPASGGVFPLGPTSVTCSATDKLNQTASDTFILTVVDETPAVITVPADMTVEATSAAGAVVEFDASATDLVDPDPEFVCSPATGSTFAITTTTVFCQARDSSNNDVLGGFLVTVQDTTPPVITVPADMTVEAGTAAAFEVTATDLVDPDPSVECDQLTGSVFESTTTVNCSATDDFDNSTSGSFTVTVLDSTPPVIAPAIDGTLGDNGWYTSDVTVSWTVDEPESDVTATTGCDPVTLDSDTADTMLTCSATSAGGTSSGDVTIKRDATVPTVTFTGNLGSYELLDTVTIDCSATDTGSGIATDTCLDLNAPAWSFAHGSHNLSAEATDLAGNVESGSTSFIVMTTYDDLCTLTMQLVSNHGSVTSACAMLKVAKKAEASGEPDDWATVAEMLANYREKIDYAIREGYVSNANGDMLKDWSRALMGE